MGVLLRLEVVLSSFVVFLEGEGVRWNMYCLLLCRWRGCSW